MKLKYKIRYLDGDTLLFTGWGLQPVDELMVEGKFTNESGEVFDYDADEHYIDWYESESLQQSERALLIPDPQ